MYLGRNLSRDSRYTISGDGGVDYYLITSYDAPFENLSNLKELIIGENVGILGPEQEYIPEVDLYVTPGSFKNCSSIQFVDVKNPTPPTGVEFTDNVYSKAQAIIPKGTINAYKEADGWMKFSFLQEKLEQYNLTFKIGDEVYLIKKVTEGEKIVLPEKPVKEGYTFSGWGEVPETMPAHDVTYTANIDDAIRQLTIDNGKLTIYDLTGRKIEVDDLRELRKGIYIINGQKMIIKD